MCKKHEESIVGTSNLLILNLQAKFYFVKINYTFHVKNETDRESVSIYLYRSFFLPSRNFFCILLPLALNILYISMIIMGEYTRWHVWNHWFRSPEKIFGLWIIGKTKKRFFTQKLYAGRNYRLEVQNLWILTKQMEHIIIHIIHRKISPHELLTYLAYLLCLSYKIHNFTVVQFHKRITRWYKQHEFVFQDKSVTILPLYFSWGISSSNLRDLAAVAS